MSRKEEKAAAPSARLLQEGLALYAKGDRQGACERFNRVVTLEPDNAGAWSNLGVALRAMGHEHAAMSCYLRSMSLRPDDPGVHSNYGNLLRQWGRLDEALAAHEKAIRLNSKFVDAIYNRGLVLQDMGRFDEAIKHFDTAKRLEPNREKVLWDKSLALLMKGDLKAGFELYEERWNLPESRRMDLSTPLWDGSHLGGRTIFLYSEQGFGDTLQFLRFVPMVAARGGHVVLSVQPELVRLCSSLEGLGSVVVPGSPMPRHDVHAPLLSLARIFGIELESIPDNTPYLSAPGDRMILPQTAGEDSTRLKVGICWAGKPTHKNDFNRSIGLEPFLSLLEVADVDLYGLQFGPRGADIAACGATGLVRDITSGVKDFADSAGLLDSLDLVISVDTSLVHLCGALRKTVWTLLPYSADWRWLAQRSDSPWYPEMRLFRQPKAKDWDSVFADLRIALADYARSESN